MDATATTTTSEVVATDAAPKEQAQEETLKEFSRPGNYQYSHKREIAPTSSTRFIRLFMLDKRWLIYTNINMEGRNQRINRVAFTN